MSRLLLLCAIAGALLLTTGTASGRDEPAPDPDPDDPPAKAGVPDALRSALEALGASTGIPDGVGVLWTPRAPVRNQSARMGLTNYQFGLNVPVYTTDDDFVFAATSIRSLDIRSNAILPTDRVKFPRSLWDAQAGGGYVQQIGSGWSWGATLNLGTATDRPFNSLAEATLSALTFLRMPTDGRNGWLFYVVSTSNGQLGRNIPVPGVAYEYHAALLTAVIGFPFVTIDYRPIREAQFEMTYAALTDLTARASYHVSDHARLFTGFEWANQAWFRAARRHTGTQLFLYEKRVEGGFGWKIDRRLDFRMSSGYAFDRFFVENRGLSLRGRNRTELGAARFIAAQLEFKY